MSPPEFGQLAHSPRPRTFHPALAGGRPGVFSPFICGREWASVLRGALARTAGEPRGLLQWLLTPNVS